jgi:hypothetical protein
MTLAQYAMLLIIEQTYNIARDSGAGRGRGIGQSRADRSAAFIPLFVLTLFSGSLRPIG